MTQGVVFTLTVRPAGDSAAGSPEGTRVPFLAKGTDMGLLSAGALGCLGTRPESTSHQVWEVHSERKKSYYLFLKKKSYHPILKKKVATPF